MKFLSVRMSILYSFKFQISAIFKRIDFNNYYHCLRRRIYAYTYFHGLFLQLCLPFDLLNPFISNAGIGLCSFIITLYFSNYFLFQKDFIKINLFIFSSSICLVNISKIEIFHTEFLCCYLRSTYQVG